VHAGEPQELKARNPQPSKELRRKQARNERCLATAKDDREYWDCVGQKYEDLNEPR